MQILTVLCELKRDGAESNEHVRDAMQEIANGGLEKGWGWPDLVPRIRYRPRPYAEVKGIKQCTSDMVGLNWFDRIRTLFAFSCHGRINKNQRSARESTCNTRPIMSPQRSEYHVISFWWLGTIDWSRNALCLGECLTVTSERFANRPDSADLGSARDYAGGLAAGVRSRCIRKLHLWRS